MKRYPTTTYLRLHHHAYPVCPPPWPTSSAYSKNSAATPANQHGSLKRSPLGTARRRPTQAEVVALPEVVLLKGEAAFDGKVVTVYVLHRVLHPQVHVNGIKKKKTYNHSVSYISPKGSIMSVSYRFQ